MLTMAFLSGTRALDVLLVVSLFWVVDGFFGNCFVKSWYQMMGGLREQVGSPTDDGFVDVVGKNLRAGEGWKERNFLQQ